MGNSMGTIFRITTFGESHGKAIGVVIDGCPAGVMVDEQAIAAELSRRRPGQSAVTTSRKEDDTPEVLSGVLDGKSTGAPIAILIRNKDAKSEQYQGMEGLVRPGHANFSWLAKYGAFDGRGGGRASARETACRVAAGAIAKSLLSEQGIHVRAWVEQIGDVAMPAASESTGDGAHDCDPEENALRCPNRKAASAMEVAILRAKEEGDSLGGIVRFSVEGCPAGLGEPLYERMESELAKAMLCIPAAKAFGMGNGFDACAMRGSEHNDVPTGIVDGKLTAKTNHAGGVQGGITTGMPLTGTVGFKPTSTIRKEQQTIDLQGKAATFAPPADARHDPCVVSRAVAVVEAMAALVVADFLLRARCARMQLSGTQEQG
ncbi:chorismate synthase, partial [Candidatus Woesearchaeota archaeon CG11_big_fil_rev_8_21_14_0_20_57_5]